MLVWLVRVEGVVCVACVGAVGGVVGSTVAPAPAAATAAVVGSAARPISPALIALLLLHAPPRAPKACQVDIGIATGGGLICAGIHGQDAELAGQGGVGRGEGGRGDARLDLVPFGSRCV